MQADIIIVGAGAAGLIAARLLTTAGKNVIVLEGSDRIGGRIHTLPQNSFSMPVEAGAEFVHGKLALTLGLLKEASLKHTVAGGDMWRSRDGQWSQQDDFVEHYELLRKKLKDVKEDKPLYDFLETAFPGDAYADFKQSVYGYAEGYYAGKRYDASTLYLREEMEKSDDEQYRVTGGYGQLADYLFNAAKTAGCRFFFSSAAKTIRWKEKDVRITTTNGNEFTASKLIVTVSPGVLQCNAEHEAHIHFEPAIDEKLTAAKGIGFGPVIKILVEFAEPFWRNDEQLATLGFLFSDETVPTWWTQHPSPSPLLTGWCAGPNADALKQYDDEALYEKSLDSLSLIFHKSKPELKDRIRRWRVCNWATYPFTLGGYTYVTVQTKEARKALAEPLLNTIYFAGEALYDGLDVGTVEAALQSGKKVAKEMLADSW